MKRSSRDQQQIGTKLLSIGCVFAKTIFDRRQQDTYIYPICNAPKEDRNNMSTCPDLAAKKDYKKGLNKLQKKKMEHLDIATIITQAIIGGLRHVHNGTTPAPYSFGNFAFGRGITISGIIKDQVDIGWINFLCGRWSDKWKQAQKRHYLQMNKKKPACLWTIAILKKLLMIRWDMWQFRNQILHSLTDLTSIVGHHSLNYQISKGKRIGINSIDQSNYHLFSKLYTTIKLQSSSIINKKLWLKLLSLARREHVEPDNKIIPLAISMHNRTRCNPSWVSMDHFYL